MENSWKKPAVSIKEPRFVSASSDDAKDTKDAIETQAVKTKQQAQLDADKVGRLLNANYFWTDWTFPFLRDGFHRAMCVTRFYPSACVAVDMFTHITPEDQAAIDLKRRLFSGNTAVVNGVDSKIRYGALDWSMPLADLLPQLGDAV